MGQAVTTGAMMQCIFGLAPSTLNVLPINRIMIGGKPAANILDNKPYVNIVPFGLCRSLANPTVIAKKGVPSPCTPMTFAPWLIGTPVTMVGPMPILNNTSKLVCSYGGMINILFPGQVNVMA